VKVEGALGDCKGVEVVSTSVVEVSVRSCVVPFIAGKGGRVVESALGSNPILSSMQLEIEFIPFPRISASYLERSVEPGGSH